MPFRVSAYDAGIPYQYRRDKTTTAGYYYNGWSDPGAATSAAKWKIYRETIATDGDVTEIKFASGSINFDQIWDNRATLSYS